MIAKGGARSGPKQLANYLMRVGRYDTGEPAKLLELRSPWADAPNGTQERTAAKLVEAFRDWQTLAEGTQQGEFGLYHAQISPAPEYAKNMTDEQWMRAADILAKELGLENQERALVLHAGKDDRPHLHIVWARCDLDTMKLISDSYNYVAHERASARMEKEFGHEFVPGKHVKRDREQQPEFPQERMSQDEAQQAVRLGMTKEERIAQLAEIRKSCDDGLAFKNALEQAGYVLAKGDTRGFVLVDGQGEIFSLSKHLPDLKGKEYKAFMASVDRALLPGVDEARALQEAREQARQAAAKVEPPAEPQKPAPEASKFLPPELAQKLEQPSLTSPQPEKQAVSEQPTAPPPEPPASKFLPSLPEKAPEAAPVPAEQKAPTEDPELIALKKAIAERQAEDAQKWVEYEALERRQKDFELGNEAAWKLEDFDLRQQEERDAFFERINERRKGVWGVIDAINARLNPVEAAEKAAAQRKEINQFRRRQEIERRDYIRLQEQTRQMELDALRERQHEQQRLREKQYAEDRERYIREHHAAQRILAEQEAKRIKEELEKTQDKKKGPPPPTMGK